MSTNWTFYEMKMAELHRARVENRPLLGQLEEIMRFVQECEARWSMQESRRLSDPEADA